MRFKTILIGLTLVSSLALQGCYTQLAMFYPDPEVEQDEDGQFYETYSRAPRRPNLGIYAQDGGNGNSLAYSTMQNRFNPFFGYSNYNNGYGNYYGGGYGNDYGYGYNPYGYNYNLGGYPLFIPVTDSKELRAFNKERSRQHQTNLKTTRTSSSSAWQSSSSSRNSSSISSTRSSGSSSSGSSSSSSSSSSGGRRATRRN